MEVVSICAWPCASSGEKIQMLTRCRRMIFLHSLDENNVHSPHNSLHSFYLSRNSKRAGNFLTRLQETCWKWHLENTFLPLSLAHHSRRFASSSACSRRRNKQHHTIFRIFKQCEKRTLHALIYKFQDNLYTLVRVVQEAGICMAPCPEVLGWRLPLECGCCQSKFGIFTAISPTIDCHQMFTIGKTP